jgi:hypothetical protein
MIAFAAAGRDVFVAAQHRLRQSATMLEKAWRGA